MIEDAKNGFTEAQVDYGLSLWKGDINAGIPVDKREGYRWMARASARGYHDLYAKVSLCVCVR